MSKEGDGKGCFLHKETAGFEQSQDTEVFQYYSKSKSSWDA